MTNADRYVYYDPSSSYIFHLIRYELWTENVRRISKLEADTLNDELSSSDYFFLRHIQKEDQKLLAEAGYTVEITDELQMVNLQ